mmetsp:Transcript_19674/g.32253  ORF Transcript_19674/g.32253 Transcript_19674/m.32253 type:complete len:204 (-) Transcript_19674:63-674(-)
MPSRDLSADRKKSVRRHFEFLYMPFRFNSRHRQMSEHWLRHSLFLDRSRGDLKGIIAFFFVCFNLRNFTAFDLQHGHLNLLSPLVPKAHHATFFRQNSGTTPRHNPFRLSPILFDFLNIFAVVDLWFPVRMGNKASTAVRNERGVFRTTETPLRFSSSSLPRIQETYMKRNNRISRMYANGQAAENGARNARMREQSSRRRTR